MATTQESAIPPSHVRQFKMDLKPSHTQIIPEAKLMSSEPPMVVVE
jgi:hypothetical protein